MHGYAHIDGKLARMHCVSSIGYLGQTAGSSSCMQVLLLSSQRHSSGINLQAEWQILQSVQEIDDKLQ